jgi:hypothetical protein
LVTARRVAAGDMLDDPAFGMHNCVMKLTLCIAAVAVAFGTTFYALTGWEELAMWFSAGLVITATAARVVRALGTRGRVVQSGSRMSGNAFL